MSDDAGIAQGDPDTQQEPAADGAQEALRTGPVLSRRRFLRVAVAGGVVVGVASLGFWGGEFGGPLNFLAPSTPQPSGVPAPRRYRSRPDLSSPFIWVTTPGLRAVAGQVFLTPAAGPGPMVVDNAGAAVWIHPVTGKRALNLRVGTYRGAPVMTWWEGEIVNGTGNGEYVVVDESYTEITRVRAGNGLQGDLHEFLITPQGTALFTVYTQLPRPAVSPGSTQILESIVQEVDIASGRVLFEWHSADHVSPSESYSVPTTGQPFDYFHINSIDIEPDGNLLISARHTWAVYRIDRQSGEVMWRLGGKQSDFKGSGTQFAWQHDARRQPDGSITLFDDGSNGSHPPTEDHSRGIVLEIDEIARTATLRREYSHAGILAKSQGSMQTLPNGNVLVGWGDQPFYTEFAADGAVVMDARLADGSFSYRALRFPWHGRPSESPVAVADSVDGTATTVTASWNGATDVAVWVVLGGDSAEALGPVASQPRAGFETVIEVPGRPAVLAVKALDSSRRDARTIRAFPRIGSAAATSADGRRVGGGQREVVRRRRDAAVGAGDRGHADVVSWDTWGSLRRSVHAA